MLKQPSQMQEMWESSAAVSAPRNIYRLDFPVDICTIGYFSDWFVFRPDILSYREEVMNQAFSDVHRDLKIGEDTFDLFKPDVTESDFVQKMKKFSPDDVTPLIPETLKQQQAQHLRKLNTISADEYSAYFAQTEIIQKQVNDSLIAYTKAHKDKLLIDTIKKRLFVNTQHSTLSTIQILNILRFCCQWVYCPQYTIISIYIRLIQSFCGYLYVGSKPVGKKRISLNPKVINKSDGQYVRCHIKVKYVTRMNMKNGIDKTVSDDEPFFTLTLQYLLPLQTNSTVVMEKFYFKTQYLDVNQQLNYLAGILYNNWGIMLKEMRGLLHSQHIISPEKYRAYLEYASFNVKKNIPRAYFYRDRHMVRLPLVMENYKNFTRKKIFVDKMMADITKPADIKSDYVIPPIAPVHNGMIATNFMMISNQSHFNSFLHKLYPGYTFKPIEIDKIFQCLSFHPFNPVFLFLASVHTLLNNRDFHFIEPVFANPLYPLNVKIVKSSTGLTLTLAYEVFYKKAVICQDGQPIDNQKLGGSAETPVLGISFTLDIAINFDIIDKLLIKVTDCDFFIFSDKLKTQLNQFFDKVEQGELQKIFDENFEP